MSKKLGYFFDIFFTTDIDENCYPSKGMKS